VTIHTDNFHPDTDPKLLCTCGHPDCDRRSVSQDHLERVQKTRDIVNHSLSVTSGGRCPNHPDESHRTTPADHQKQQGCDVAVTGATRGNVVQAGIAAGCNAIGVAKTFVHLGYRPELTEGHVTMWVY
jgi:hypothetical protein